MPFIPNTDDDRQIMLEKIGVADFEELLAPIPGNLRLRDSIKLPPPLSEVELIREIKTISLKNKSDLVNFAGGGVYDHFIPAALENLLSRPEFATAYTPYQAEVAQGTLQAVYEFQTCICRLTGMDVANASMYDGASAVAEAANLSLGKTGRSKIAVTESLNPIYRNVLTTYLSGREIEIVTVPIKDGTINIDSVKTVIDDTTACLIMSQPNFFGLLENIDIVSELIHKVGGHLILAVDPIAQVLIKTPYEYGVDIVVGEGQPLGIPLNFGGPLLGFFAVKKELVRSLPGRLAGRTVDADGRPGFVLTLQTREQHIRRDKASSNICTNQALCATAATIYMSLLGKAGLKKVALLSMEKTHQAADKITELTGFELLFKGDFIREVAIRTPIPAGELIEKVIAEESVLPGIDLGRFYPGMDHGLLLAVTEKRTDEEIDLLVSTLKECTSNVVSSSI
jgi:glycine dehydrogenase subunit 1